jgi:ribonuclease HI
VIPADFESGKESSGLTTNAVDSTPDASGRNRLGGVRPRHASGLRTSTPGEHVMAETISASFDGACEPNNPGGHMGLGWVIDGRSYHEYIRAAYKNTNNIAEYLALSNILDHAIQTKATTLLVTGDSLLVICQLNGAFAVRSRSLERYYLVAKKLLSGLRTSGCVVTLMWVPREQNTDADKASHDALTEHGIRLTRRMPDPGWTTRLGEMAEQLGISAVALGGILDRLELRNNKEPSERAIVEGYAQNRYNGHGVSIDWHMGKVIELVRGSGDDPLRVTGEQPLKNAVNRGARVRRPSLTHWKQS